MNYELRIKNRGFMALMSVIIISVILLLIASTLSFSGFSGRLNILDSEYKERSLALADACLDTAILRLATNPAYVGGPPDVSVGSDKCTIRPIISDLTSFTIETKASYQKSITNLKVKISKLDLSIITWQEVPNF